jgi:hypothetical protein
MGQLLSGSTETDHEGSLCESQLTWNERYSENKIWNDGVLEK